MIQGYRISRDFNDMDLTAIHAYLSNSYWSENIPFSVMAKALENSQCFGVFTDSGEQVGFARMITDTATFAYLADVYVLPTHRGKGLSKWLMQEIEQHPQLQGLRRTVLVTRDAHGLYDQFGYSKLANPEGYMEKINPTVYKLK